MSSADREPSKLTQQIDIVELVDTIMREHEAKIEKMLTELENQAQIMQNISYVKAGAR